LEIASDGMTSAVPARMDADESLEPGVPLVATTRAGVW
jgi:hypothetical protein